MTRKYSEGQKSDSQTVAIEVAEPFSAEATFKDWSRPIGLVLLVLFAFIEYGLDKPVSGYYLGMVGFLLGVPEIMAVVRRPER